MRISRVIFVLGLIVAMMPYLGFPRSVESSLLVVIGLLISLLILFRKYRKVNRSRTIGEENRSFVENGHDNNQINTSHYEISTEA